MRASIEEMVEEMRCRRVESNPIYPLNDIGTAKLFYDLCKEVICYVPEAKSWYIFSGERWGRDSGGLAIMELCKVFSQAMHGYALNSQEDNDYFIKYATALQGRKRRESILRDACSIAPRSLSDFDNDKLLFNCINGTYNLATMTLQPHRSTDYLTKLSGTEFQEEIRCSRWEQFIAEVMQGDADTARFLQKSLGYCLSGETWLECFFILYGSTTRNGKTTACETIASIMGEYARTAQPETLARRSSDGSAPTPDIARLKGARFLNMPEPERGLELNAALIKQLTGGDAFTGRLLNENPVEFTPEFKIFINTNHLPRTGDDTVFSSDRVKLIPFERHFAPQEQDTGLKALFRQKDSLSGILNWLIEGYRLLQQEGLMVPERVLQATREYRQETDIVGTFLNDTLMEAEGGRVPTGTLYRKYVDWAKDNGYRALNSKNFVGELRRRYDIRRDGTRGNEILNVDYIPANAPWRSGI